MLSTSFFRDAAFFFKVFIILITSCCLKACFFSQNSAPTLDISGALVKPPLVGTQHIVKQGETLYSIAWRYGLDYRQLARLNGIGGDFLIFPGQVVKIEPKSTDSIKKGQADKAASQVVSARSVKTVVSNDRAVVATTPNKSGLSTAYPERRSYRSKKQSSSPARLTTSKLGAPTVTWRWPAKGEVITNFSAKNATNKGIDIEGKKGDSVHAAASGNIVYAGSGLRGYGKLIIIKHSEKYLSAYAHNNKIVVKEGQYVKAGQYIADIGSSGTRTDDAKLHFEIRRDGKPVDPLGLLPRRKH